MSLGAGMLKGTAKLLNAVGDEIIDSVFIERLGHASEREIIRSARERRGGQMGFAETILLVYNKKTHTTPSLDQLYRKKSRKKKAIQEEI